MLLSFLNKYEKETNPVVTAKVLEKVTEAPELAELRRHFSCPELEQVVVHTMKRVE